MSMKPYRSKPPEARAVQLVSVLLLAVACTSSYGLDPHGIGEIGARVDESDILTTIHVSPSGNDTTGNGSPASPYRTLYKGLQAASKKLSSGIDTRVYLHNGTYVETRKTVWGANNSGRMKEAVMVLEGESKAGVVVRHDNADPSWFLLRITNKDNLVIRNISFTGSKGPVLHGAGSWAYMDTSCANWLIEDCAFDSNCAAVAVHNVEIYPVVRHMTIRRCTFNGNGANGVYLRLRDALIEDIEANDNFRVGFKHPSNQGAITLHGRNVLLRRASALRNRGEGFDNDHVGTHVTIDSCTFSENELAGFHCEIGLGPWTVSNTTISDNGEQGMRIANTNDFTLENCIVRHNGGDQIWIISRTNRIYVYPDGPSDMYNCCGGSGDFTVAHGEPVNFRIPVGALKNTVFTGNVIAANTAASLLIRKHTNNTSWDEYRTWYQTQFAGADNTYYSPGTDAFEIYQGALTDLDGWKRETGTEVGSCWSNQNAPTALQDASCAAPRRFSSGSGPADIRCLLNGALYRHSCRRVPVSGAFVVRPNRSNSR